MDGGEIFDDCLINDGSLFNGAVPFLREVVCEEDKQLRLDEEFDDCDLLAQKFILEQCVARCYLLKSPLVGANRVDIEGKDGIGKAWASCLSS